MCLLRINWVVCGEVYRKGYSCGWRRAISLFANTLIIPDIFRHYWVVNPRVVRSLQGPQGLKNIRTNSIVPIAATFVFQKCYFAKTCKVDNGNYPTKHSQNSQPKLIAAELKLCRISATKSFRIAPFCYDLVKHQSRQHPSSQWGVGVVESLT